MGVFCHGRAAVLRGAERDALRDHVAGVYGADPETLADGITYVRIDPGWLVGFAMTDVEQAHIDAGRG